MPSTVQPATARNNVLKKLGERVYPKNIWYLVVTVIGVAMICNIISMLWSWKRRRTVRKPEIYSPTQRPKSISVRRLPAAIITASRIFSFRWRLPAVSMTFLEIILTCIYIVALFTYCFANTQNLVLRYWANRSGHIAAAQIPLIIALGTKNNAIGLLTGVGHEKLNLMHRVVSRVTLVMVWVHLWARYMTDSSEVTSEAWIIAGLIACVAQTLLTFLSFQWIRRRFYEMYYLTHMVLVIIFIITTWVHLARAHPGFSYYLWPGIIVWGLDRFIRYFYYAFRNHLFHPKKSCGTLELVSHDALRLTIKRCFVGGWIAGQHMFLSFPSVNPTQSHPFSISTVSDGDEIEKDLIFIMRVRGGLTKTLREHVIGHGTCELPVFMDGPYGLPADITGFSTCVFVAGGAGITYIMPRFEDILYRAKHEKACARRLVFIWAIRERCHLQWIATRLTKLASSIPPNISVSISVYITASLGHIPGVPYSEQSSQTDIEASSPIEDKNEKRSSTISEVDVENSGISLLRGRPDVAKLLEGEVETANGPVSVDVSGPDTLVATVRSALSSSFASPMSVLRGAPAVQLNVEEFRM
ncbi:Ferric/Cupric Reductase Transmembrane Component [Abortiporus biennis]